jgi:hypothetical protein
LLYFGFRIKILDCLTGPPCNKKVVSVFVRFRLPSDSSNLAIIYIML